MTNNNVLEFTGREETSDPLTELLKSGAQQLIRHAVEAELAEFMSRYSELQTEDGKALVVRNGHLPERSKTGEPVTFQSALVPPYVRKTKSLEAAIPWLYLKGISSGEMDAALKVLLGVDAKGLSASTVSRLKQLWAEEYRNWRNGALDKDRWVYIWVDGIYSGLRGEQAKLCALVVIGVNELGDKHFVAIEDGMRESTQSWREVLLMLKSRGMNAPEVATGTALAEHPDQQSY